MPDTDDVLTPDEEKMAKMLEENFSDDELAAMEAEGNDEGDETVADNTKAEMSDDMKAQLADIENAKAEIASARLELSTAKVRRFAEERLVPKKLHAKQVDDFVAKTMELNLNDTEKKDGKTALDLRLDWEFKSRGDTVDFSDTAEVPAQDEGH